MLQKGLVYKQMSSLFSFSLLILLYLFCSPETAQTNLSHDQEYSYSCGSI